MANMTLSFDAMLQAHHLQCSVTFTTVSLQLKRVNILLLIARWITASYKYDLSFCFGFSRSLRIDHFLQALLQV